jgi:hypothetical protein
MKSGYTLASAFNYFEIISIFVWHDRHVVMFLFYFIEACMILYSLIEKGLTFANT